MISGEGIVAMGQGIDHTFQPGELGIFGNAFEGTFRCQKLEFSQLRIDQGAGLADDRRNRTVKGLFLDDVDSLSRPGLIPVVTQKLQTGLREMPAWVP